MRTNTLIVFALSVVVSATASATASAPAATIATMARKRDDGPTCRDDPAGYALSCLPYADDDHNCADNDLRCLCKLLTTNGNSDISNGRCVSDGCINGPGAGGESGYSSASAYQSSFCSSVIATPSPTSTSASISSP